jgi:hypothetical protein
MSAFEKIKALIPKLSSLSSALLSIVSLALLLSDYFTYHSDATGLEFGYADKYTETKAFARSTLDAISQCAIKAGCLEWNCPCLLNQDSCAIDKMGPDGKVAPYDKITLKRSGCVMFYSNCPPNYCLQCKTFRKFASRESLQITAYFQYRIVLYFLLAAYVSSCFYMLKTYTISHHLPVLGGVITTIHYLKKLFGSDGRNSLDGDIEKYGALVSMWESITMDLPNIVIKLYIYAVSEGLPTRFLPTDCSEIVDWRFATFLISMLGFCKTLYLFILARCFPSLRGSDEESIIVSGTEKGDRFVRLTTYFLVIAIIVSFTAFGIAYPSTRDNEIKLCENGNKNIYTTCQSISTP